MLAIVTASDRDSAHRSLDCCSPLQLSAPQPAVDNRSELWQVQAQGLAAGCLHESGSRLPQSKGSRLCSRNYFYWLAIIFVVLLSNRPSLRLRTEWPFCTY
ncbi:MAG: hypothetical protein DWI00_17530 [Planctomycetota bacterium]|nr:MAG: hypothetical protein DWI00_17530 [Planctomycetota bacterium]